MRGSSIGVWALGLLAWALGCSEPRPARTVSSESKGESAPQREAPTLGLVRGEGDEADGWLARGEVHFRAGRLDEASHAFRKANALLPKHPAPVVGLTLVEFERAELGLEFASRRDDPKVLELLGQLEAANSPPDFALAWLVRGRLLLLLGEAERARSVLENAVALDPRDARAFGALGIACLALGDSSGAVSNAKAAVDLNPKSAALWSNLGAAWMMSEQPEQARQAYERAVELSPNSARAHSDLGTTLIAMGQAGAALTELEEAHRLAPDRATVMNNLGYALQSLGEVEGAENWYRRSLAADPSLGSAWVNLGVLCAKSQRFDEASAAFEQALRLDPEDPRALENVKELERERAVVEASP
jgi:Flp pilus assembly protein TadD